MNKGATLYISPNCTMLQEAGCSWTAPNTTKTKSQIAGNAPESYPFLKYSQDIMAVLGNNYIS